MQPEMGRSVKLLPLPGSRYSRTERKIPGRKEYFLDRTFDSDTQNPVSTLEKTSDALSHFCGIFTTINMRYEGEFRVARKRAEPNKDSVLLFLDSLHLLPFVPRPVDYCYKWLCIYVDKVHQRQNTKECYKIEEVIHMEEKEYFSEFFNFACILRGEVKYIEEVKEYIVKEYMEKGLIKLIKPVYDKEQIFLMKKSEWEEYQKLKERNDRLIGAGFP